MVPIVYETFEEAYLAALAGVRHNAEFCNAPRGYRSREVLGLAYRILNPRERAVTLPSRHSNIIFNFAEALWYLSGGNSLDCIGFYAPSIRKFSRDGRTLLGTAYGPRIFSFGNAEINQWNSVLHTLQHDRDSKRAVIQISTPEELLIKDNIDVACTVALQFVIREDRLHAITFMRANDAYRGVVSDVFSFTFLQEVLANELRVEMGTYTHLVGSYHLYESDRRRADEVLGCSRERICDVPFPKMPRGNNWPAIKEVLSVEEALRQRRLVLGRQDIETLGLDLYWLQIVALLSLFCQRRFAGAVDEDTVGLLHPLYSAIYRNMR